MYCANRFISSIFFLIISTYCIGKTTSLTDIPFHIFFPNGKSDFNKIFIHHNIKEEVEKIYNQSILFHEYTKEIQPNSNFNVYWSVYENQWNAVDLDQNGINELIFNGLTSYQDEKEYLEIYQISDGKYSQIYAEIGKLLAYEIHPNTKEIILHHHRYPCCNSASHNLITIRLLNKKIFFKDKFFVGRDHGDMKGPFYPDSIILTNHFEILTSPVSIHWSPEEINHNAFTGISENNILAFFESGGIFQILNITNDWYFVLLHSGILSRPTPLLNPSNFKNKSIYGWLKKSDYNLTN